MIWLKTWRTLTLKILEMLMMMTTKVGRQRTRWRLRQSRMTANSPSPNTLVKSCVRFELLLSDDSSLPKA